MHSHFNEFQDTSHFFSEGLEGPETSFKADKEKSGKIWKSDVQFHSLSSPRPLFPFGNEILSSFSSFMTSACHYHKELTSELEMVNDQDF